MLGHFVQTVMKTIYYVVQLYEKSRCRVKLRLLRCVAHSGLRESTEPVFLNVYGAPELIPRNGFRQPM
jgi:hypothetical protein